MEFLVLKFEAPLMSFGTVAVDETIKTARFPAQSMVAGIVGNAMGLTRTQWDRLQAIQDGMTVLSRIDRPGSPLRDFHTAALRKDDVMWTSRGAPVGRDGGVETYNNPSLSNREYWQDASVTVFVSLPADLLAEAETALRKPARPLFLGRKSCIPSARVFAGRVAAARPLDVLRHGSEEGVLAASAQWPAALGTPEGVRVTTVHDLKNWRSGVHLRSRRVCEGTVESTL